MALTAHDLASPAHLFSFDVQMIQSPDDGARAEAALQLIERLSQMPGMAAVGPRPGSPLSHRSGAPASPLKGGR